MSHTDQHNHLTGSEPLDTSAYSNVISVRCDNVQSWKDKGYEVISDDDQSALMGIKNEVSVEAPTEVPLEESQKESTEV